VTSSGNNFTEFPDNQLTTVRVGLFIGWSRVFYFLWSMDRRPWQTQRTNRQTDMSLSVCPIVSIQFAAVW